MESEGSNISNDNKENKQWRAEEAIAGNAEALQALRELITFPLYYSSQAKKLGLKVSTYIQTNKDSTLFTFYFLFNDLNRCY